MSINFTDWKISLISNSIAVSLTAIVSYVFAQKHNENFKWYDTIIVFLISFLIVFIAYGIVYYIFKYLPMSKIS